MNYIKPFLPNRDSPDGNLNLVSFQTSCVSGGSCNAGEEPGSCLNIHPEYETSAP